MATIAAITATQAAVASTAISVAAVIQSTIQARKVANAQKQAQQRRNEALSQQAVDNYDQLADIELEQQQKSIDTTLEVQKNYIQEKGRVNVMSAAMGTGGMSVTSQLKDLEQQKYSNYSTILKDKQVRMDNIRSQASAIRYQAANSMDISPISRPSYAAAALNIGSSLASGYAGIQQGKAMDAQLAKPTVSTGG